MPRSKTTVYIDSDALRAARIRAARTGKTQSDVVEEALREYLGLAAMEQIRAKGDLGEDEAMRLANHELHALRRERRAG
jgi:hypothetical protein